MIEVGSVARIVSPDQTPSAWDWGVLGRAVLQVIDEMPDYPSDPNAMGSVSDDQRGRVLRFASEFR
jgi:hypothetical protein